MSTSLTVATHMTTLKKRGAHAAAKRKETFHATPSAMWTTNMLMHRGLAHFVYKRRAINKIMATIITSPKAEQRCTNIVTVVDRLTAMNRNENAEEIDTSINTQLIGESVSRTCMCTLFGL